MEFHPIANIFPLLMGPEYQEFIEDVRQNGLREPIQLYEGKILDGRNRYRACEEANVEPLFEQWQGKDPIQFVLSMNLHRRHLDSSQRAACAVAALPHLEEEARKREAERKKNINNPTLNSQRFDESNGRASEQAAKAFGTNRQYVSDAKKLAEERPELFERVKAGELTIPRAKQEIARERQEHNSRSESGTYLVDNCKVIIGDARNMDLSQFGEGYKVIVADPPWKYRVSLGEGVAKDQYATLDEEDLMTMPLDQLADKNCVLFLWGTWPKLPEALQVMQAWGFKYVTGLPWVKTTTNNLKNTPISEITLNYGVGYWVRGVSEFILIGRRGNVSAPKLKGFLGIISPNLNHSHKPNSIHEIAEAMEGPYLELFARRSRPGWTVFGNEVQGVF